MLVAATIELGAAVTVSISETVTVDIELELVDSDSGSKSVDTVGFVSVCIGADVPCPNAHTVISVVFADVG